MSDLVHDWNPPSRPAREPRLDDETLRDGLQCPGAVQPSVAQKLELLRLMDALDIETADVGMPGAGARARAEAREVALAMTREKLRVAPNFAARTLEADLRPVADIAQACGREVTAALFVGSSPLRRLAEDWDLDDLVRRTRDATAFARRHGVDVMFVTEDTTRSRPADLERLFLAAVEAGASRLCLCDTAGHATPPGAAALVRWTRSLLDGRGLGHVRLDFHGHMDRGLGVWNSLAALEAGADRVHGTALGIGERAGNTPLDQVLVNLGLLGWIEGDLRRLGEYCATASRITGVPVPDGYPVAGRHAFETGSGVHAAAIVKALGKGDRWLADRVYSAVPASDFGRQQSISVGPLSGRANVVGWLRSRGMEAGEARVAAILERAKRSDRILADAEILEITRGTP